jgi:hypothetical protein
MAAAKKMTPPKKDNNKKGGSYIKPGETLGREADKVINEALKILGRIVKDPYIGNRTTPQGKPRPRLNEPSKSKPNSNKSTPKGPRPRLNESAKPKAPQKPTPRPTPKPPTPRTPKPSRPSNTIPKTR